MRGAAEQPGTVPGAVPQGRPRRLARGNAFHHNTNRYDAQRQDPAARTETIIFYSIPSASGLMVSCS